MLAFVYRLLCIDLYYKVQILLLELIEVLGDEKQIFKDVTLRQLVNRMEASYLDGIKAEKSTKNLKQCYSDFSKFKSELKRMKASLIPKK